MLVRSEHSTLAANVNGPTPPRPVVSDSRLRLRMDFTDPRLAVLTVAGDLDMTTTPRLSELLWPRLRTKLTTMVLDLGEVSFLGVAGLELLADAHNYAWHRGITLCLAGRSRAVDRALVAAGLESSLPCFADLPEARAALTAPNVGTTNTVQQPQVRRETLTG